jgi:hypothetical protein
MNGARAERANELLDQIPWLSWTECFLDESRAAYLAWKEGQPIVKSWNQADVDAVSTALDVTARV